MSNVCNAAQPVEEYIIHPARVAVMNVRDELAAQSPRKLHGPMREQRARDSTAASEESTRSGLISLVLSALRHDWDVVPRDHPLLPQL